MASVCLSVARANLGHGEREREEGRKEIADDDECEDREVYSKGRPGEDLSLSREHTHVRNSYPGRERRAVASRSSAFCLRGV